MQAKGERTRKDSGATVKHQKAAVPTERNRRPYGSRSQLTVPRALADAMLSMNGYVFNEKNSQSDREFRRLDARAMLKALRGLGFVVVPKDKRQP